jgi:hypothetical protein
VPSGVPGDALADALGNALGRALGDALANAAGQLPFDPPETTTGWVSIRTREGSTAWYTSSEKAGGRVSDASAEAMLLLTSPGVSGRGAGATAPYNSTPTNAASTPRANGPAHRIRARNPPVRDRRVRRTDSRRDR